MEVIAYESYLNKAIRKKMGPKYYKHYNDVVRIQSRKRVAVNVYILKIRCPMQYYNMASL